MKLESVKDFETNTINSNLFGFSFESKANAVMLVIAWSPYYEPTNTELVASTFSLASICVIFGILLYSLEHEIDSMIHKKENQINKKMNIIKFMVLIVFVGIFISSLPTIIGMFNNAKKELKYGIDLDELFCLFQSVCVILIFGIFIYLLVISVVNAILKRKGKVYEKYEKGKKRAVKYIIMFFGIIILINVISYWNLKNF